MTMAPPRRTRSANVNLWMEENEIHRCPALVENFASEAEAAEMQ